ARSCRNPTFLFGIIYAILKSPIMNQSPRPSDSAPGGMRGATRMVDPTEAEHDHTRRLVMNIAFVLIVMLNVAQWHVIGIHGWDWLSAITLAVAAAPLGLALKVFELRFKMAGAERRRALRELPGRRVLELLVYAVLLVLSLGRQTLYISWALLGV